MIDLLLFVVFCVRYWGGEGGGVVFFMCFFIIVGLF